MSSFIQKAEAFLAEIGTELTVGEHAIAAWFRRLLHHEKAGDVITPPPQSGTGDAAGHVGTGTAPTPVITAPTPPTMTPTMPPTPPTAPPPVDVAPPAAPAPAPVAASPEYPVDGIASFADAAHTIRIKYLDDLRVIEPRVPHRFRIQDMAKNPAKFNLSEVGAKVVHADCNTDMFLDQTAFGGNQNAPWRQSQVYTDNGPGGTMQQGAQIPDALTFDGENFDANGAQTYEGVTLANLPTKIEQWKANGLLPIIDHQPGVVAGP